MRRHVALVVWLVVAWVAFWRDVSAANILSGLLVAALTIALFPLPSEAGSLQFRLIPGVRFLLRSAWSIIRANVVVAWEVVTPTNQINEGVVAVELPSHHPTVITLVSHAIILAPGTMVVDIDVGDDTRPTTLFVHVLHLRSVQDVRDEVVELGALAMAAVGLRTSTPQEEARP